MYARLYAASATPICVLCSHLPRFRTTQSTRKRRYAAQAALASQPAPNSEEAESNKQGPSKLSAVAHSTKQCDSSKNRPKLDARAKAEQAKQKAYEQTAKAARKALKEAQEAERRRRALSILDKTTKFVAAVQETSLEPTLADLEQFRPRHAPLITLKFIYPEPSARLRRGSPSDVVVERYNIAFQTLVDTLSRRFRRKQLLKLLKEGMRQRTTPLLGTPRPLNSLKLPYQVAEEIVRWLWDWPYVTEVQKRKAYLTTRAERVFSISTSEFFLLLGSDGSLLLTLTESFGVVVKNVRKTEDAFALVIEGPSYMLDQLASVLTERKKAIISEIVQLDVQDKTTKDSLQQGDSPIRSDLIQRISKLSNALVEDKGGSMFRISAHQRQNIAMAMRLVTRASQQAKLPSPSLLVHLPNSKDSTPNMMSPHTYALFPFEVSAAEGLPWHWTSTGILSSPPSSAYQQDQASSSSTTPTSLSSTPNLSRARKISEWLGQDPADAVTQRRGLKDDVGRLLSSSGQPQTLRNALGLPDLHSSQSPSEISPRQRKITASTGHIVFTTASGLRSTLSPPFGGSWVFPKFLDWMKGDKGRMTFIPSSPQSLINPSPSHQSALNRLIYRASSPAIPTLVSSEQTTRMPSAEPLKTLKFEILLPEPGQHQHQQELGDAGSLRHDGNSHNSTVQSMYDDDATSSQEQPITIQPPENGSLSANSPQLWSGTECRVNIMLPDRPVDMQLSLFDSVLLPREAEPSELTVYASKLIHFLRFSDGSSRPDPPLSLTHAGIRWTLDANATVRWSSQSIAVDSGRDAEASMDVVTENTVDLESDQQGITSQVACSDTNVLLAWRKFLGDCDALTWLIGKKETRPATFLELSDDDPIDPDEMQ